jgi:muramoyltetrapeptide carboxypeptidase
MITVPPYLRKGDTVGLLCPAGYMPFERVETCISILEKWGYRVKIGKTVGHQHHYFSGTDDERLEDFQCMLNDVEIKAILCARGGYGTSRIIDGLNWENFQKHPKWIIGYSDVTVLHNHLYGQIKTASLHAPMAGAFAEANGEDEYVVTLKNALAGKKLIYKSSPHVFNKAGSVTGILVGGNLSIVAHLIGTPSMPVIKGAILFLEDVGEYLYSIDRMLVQLERAGIFKEIAGLLVGGFTELKDTVIPMGQDIYDIFKQRIKPYSFPVAFDFPVSHGRENVALRVGMPHTLEVTEMGGTLTGNPNGI